MPYEIEYSSDAIDHLAGMPKRDRQVVADEIRRQLVHEPTVPTRKRKKLRPNLLADWELRIGDLRVYYVVDEPPATVVSILAVGRKSGNRVFVSDVEMFL